MKAIILAGGKGTRLRPITHKIPKPLIPIKGKPILSHIVDFLIRSNILELAVIISKDHVKDFESWRDHYQKELSVHINIFIEEKRAGTFGCLRLAKEWIGSEDFIVFNGDSLIDFNVQSLIEFHKKNGGIATACVLQTNSSGNYIVPTVKGNRIRGLRRKVVSPASDFIYSGFYIAKADIFLYDDTSQEILLAEKDVFPKLIEVDALVSCVMDKSRFYDCGTFESLGQAKSGW